MWAGNLDENFKENHYLELRGVDGSKQGLWIVGIVDGENRGEQLFTAKDLTVDPGAECSAPLTTKARSGLICVQGRGKNQRPNVERPKLIRFTDLKRR